MNTLLGTIITALVTDENDNAVDVPNVWSDNYVNNPVLKPLKSVELTSNTGGSLSLIHI